jgi:hypothetical protein
MASVVTFLSTSYRSKYLMPGNHLIFTTAIIPIFQMKRWKTGGMRKVPLVMHQHANQAAHCKQAHSKTPCYPVCLFHVHSTRN